MAVRILFGNPWPVFSVLFLAGIGMWNDPVAAAVHSDPFL